MAEEAIESSMGNENLTMKNHNTRKGIPMHLHPSLPIPRGNQNLFFQPPLQIHISKTRPPLMVFSSTQAIHWHLSLPKEGEKPTSNSDWTNIVENKEEGVQQAKRSYPISDSSAMRIPEENEWDEFGNDLYAIPEVVPVQSSNQIQDAPPQNKADEDSKIKALIDTSALDWQQQTQEGFGPGRGFGRGMGGRIMGPSDNTLRLCSIVHCSGAMAIMTTVGASDFLLRERWTRNGDQQGNPTIDEEKFRFSVSGNLLPQLAFGISLLLDQL